MNFISDLAENTERVWVQVGNKMVVGGSSVSGVTATAQGTGFVDRIVAHGDEITLAFGFVGVAVAVLGFCISVFFSVRRDRRERERSRREYALYKAQIREIEDRAKNY